MHPSLRDSMTKTTLKKAAYIFISIALLLYIGASIRYYFSIRPELTFRSDIKGLEQLFYREMNVKQFGMDTIVLFYGSTTAKVDTGTVFGPTEILPIKNYPQLRAAKKALIIADIHSSEPEKVEVVVEINDVQGKSVYWEPKPLSTEKTSGWLKKAFLFDLPETAVKQADQFKFYTLNNKKTVFYIGAFRIQVYGKK